MKKYLSGCLLAMLLAGCYKDKGNYDLHDINEISVASSGPDTLRLQLFDRLKVEVDIRQTIRKDESALEFSWRMYEVNGGVIRLGRTKNLDTLITFPPATYRLILDVKDNSTGVTSFREFVLDITSPMSEGWVLLEDNGGVQDLSMVTPLKRVLRNIYATTNGEPLPAGSSRVGVWNVVGASQEVFVYGGQNGVWLSYINFQRQYYYRDWFFSAPKTMRPQMMFYNRFGVAGFIVNNGKVHTLGLIDNGPKKYGAPMEGDWEIAPFQLPMTNNDFTMLYDAKNQRFLKHANGSINTLASPEGSAFELNNVGKQMVYGAPGNSDFHNCLMKDNGADVFRVYRINTASDIIAAEVHPVLDAPGLERAKVFASSQTYLQLYYGVDNKVYLLDIPAGKARLAYTFPAGETVTAIRIKQSQFSLLWVVPEHDRVFAASTWNGSEGKFYEFGISSTGDFSGGTYRDQYASFGKILDIDFKNKK